MATPYYGELMLASFNFAPKNYALCNGQLLQISQNQALFSLLGTTYGGDGRVTFALPNLQGRTPIGFSNAYPQGASAGEDFHTLLTTEVPGHTHQPQGSGAAPTSFKPAASMFATVPGNPKLYNIPGNLVAMNLATISTAGGSQGHENRQPFLVMNWCIALTGIFPSRT
jgi:microcystin-dependent protein